MTSPYVAPLDSLAACQAADANDPLGQVRERFLIPEGVRYLDGNSLGVLPKATEAAVMHTLQTEWGHQLIRSWNDAGWFETPQRLGAKLAPALGVDPQPAERPSLVVTDTISINLFKVTAALQALNPERPNVLVELGAFPTDRYVITGAVGEANVVNLEGPEALADMLTGDIGVVVLSHVDYRSGFRWNMAEATATIHAAGALAVWDLAHTAGAMDIHLEACGVDAAVGCTYKYLNGGPGAPGFVYMKPDLAEQVTQPIAGWWGHAAPFAMTPDYQPAAGTARFLSGTQPILSMAALESALDTISDVDWPLVRAKSEALCQLFIERCSAITSDTAITVTGPTSPSDRGSHVSLQLENAYPVVQALIARGVIGDFREPHFARFGLAPLILSFEDVWSACDQLEDVLVSGSWADPKFSQRGAVT